MRKQRLVVFCGAGVSVDLGIPMMNQFGDALRDRQLLQSDDQIEFDRIQDHCNKMAALLGTSARNLEQMASFLAVLDAAHPKEPIRGCKRYKTPLSALRFVTECISSLTLPPVDNVRLGAMKSLLGLSSKFHLSIVTTNYDVHVELAAAKNPYDSMDIGIVTTPSVRQLADGRSRNSLYFSRAAENVPLFKLHGSSNWWMQRHRMVHVDQRYSFQGGGASAPVTCHLNKDEPPPSGATRLIVPPTVLKTQQLSVVSEQWSGAFEAIRQADRLWFIGYSFPESDSYMQYFLSAAIADNSALRQLMVVDPSSDVLANRARRFFDAPRVREVFQPVRARFQDLRCEAQTETSTEPPLKEVAGRLESRVMILAEQACKRVIESPKL